MPKMKTHRGAYKRFGITGSGKPTRSRSNVNHRRHKSKTANAQLGDMMVVAKADMPRIRRALGI